MWFISTHTSPLEALSAGALTCYFESKNDYSSEEQYCIEFLSARRRVTSRKLQSYIISAILQVTELFSMLIINWENSWINRVKKNGKPTLKNVVWNKFLSQHIVKIGMQPVGCTCIIINNSLPVPRRPCGLMDKASASGAEDCGFESHQGRIIFLWSFWLKYTMIIIMSFLLFFFKLLHEIVEGLHFHFSLSVCVCLCVRHFLWTKFQPNGSTKRLT